MDGSVEFGWQQIDIRYLFSHLPMEFLVGASDFLGVAVGGGYLAEIPDFAETGGAGVVSGNHLDPLRFRLQVVEF